MVSSGQRSVGLRIEVVAVVDQSMRYDIHNGHYGQSYNDFIVLLFLSNRAHNVGIVIYILHTLHEIHYYTIHYYMKYIITWYIITWNTLPHALNNTLKTWNAFMRNILWFIIMNSNYLSCVSVNIYIYISVIFDNYMTTIVICFYGYRCIPTYECMYVCMCMYVCWWIIE